MNIGKYNFDLEKEPVIMGILNVTPDSFSDGGKFNNLDAALKHTEEMIKDGAKIIDVGGESTRPGYTLISDEEEIGRVVPVIEAIKKNFDIAVSLDTYKTKVAEAGVKAGCDMINDVWGFKYGERDMADLVAKTGVAACVMHNKNVITYNDFVNDVVNDRMAGTVATTVMGLERGCRIFRVHDVKENYQAMMMAEKILKA